MKRVVFYLFLILLPAVVFAQDEPFIRVNGYSQIKVKSESIRITLVLTEVQRNEYNKIREKSIEEILEDLDANLKSIGFSKEDITEVWPPKPGYNNNYNKQKSVKYYFFAKNLEDAKNVTNFRIKGLSISDIKYFFPKDLELDYDALSKEALVNAKEKANYLAKEVNKKVGKIISITDYFEVPKNLNSYYSAEEQAAVITYKISVNYELLD